MNVIFSIMSAIDNDTIGGFIIGVIIFGGAQWHYERRHKS